MTALVLLGCAKYTSRVTKESGISFLENGIQLRRGMYFSNTKIIRSRPLSFHNTDTETYRGVWRVGKYYVTCEEGDIFRQIT